MRVAENQNTMRKHTHADIDSEGSESESELEFHHTHYGIYTIVSEPRTLWKEF